MSDAVTSPTLLLVLEHLGRTEGRALLKQAVKELIALDVLRVATVDEPRRLRKPKRHVLLLDGPAPIPAVRVLSGVAQLVAATEATIHEGRPARDLADVAKRMAKERDAAQRALAAALEELVEAGLVRTQERRVLVVTRTVHVRTEGGDYALEAAAKRPRGVGETHWNGVYDASGSSTDTDVDSSFDTSFDTSFDSSFDSAFDSSFDSGFSSGDSGGGGDGGGGGGDGGGGGGGGS